MQETSDLEVLSRRALGSGHGLCCFLFHETPALAATGHFTDGAKVASQRGAENGVREPTIEALVVTALAYGEKRKRLNGPGVRWLPGNGERVGRQDFRP
jgi:hypothetical protein